MPDYSFGNNEIVAGNNDNTILHISTNEIEDSRNVLVDGFWINDGMVSYMTNVILYLD